MLSSIVKSNLALTASKIAEALGYSPEDFQILLKIDFFEHFACLYGRTIFFVCVLSQIECRMALDELWRRWRGRRGAAFSGKCRRRGGVRAIPHLAQIGALLQGRTRQVRPPPGSQCRTQDCRATAAERRRTAGGRQSGWCRLHRVAEGRRRRARRNRAALTR